MGTEEHQEGKSEGRLECLYKLAVITVMYICLCLALVQFLLSNNVADLEIPFPFKISLSSIDSFLSCFLQ